MPMQHIRTMGVQELRRATLGVKALFDEVHNSDPVTAAALLDLLAAIAVEAGVRVTNGDLEMLKRITPSGGIFGSDH